jgi:hypothetical protein
MAEFCNAYPSRLKGVALINLDDVQEGIAELQRARRLGLAGVLISHMDLGPLFVELGLGHVARVRDAPRVFEAGGEHRGNKNGSLHLPG